MTFNLFRLSTVCSCFNWFSSGSLDFGRVFLQLVPFTRWVSRESGSLDWFSQCPSMFQTLSIPFHWSRTDSADSEPRLPVVVFRDICKESYEAIQQLVSHFSSLGATSAACEALTWLSSRSPRQKQLFTNLSPPPPCSKVSLKTSIFCIFHYKNFKNQQTFLFPFPFKKIMQNINKHLLCSFLTIKTDHCNQQIPSFALFTTKWQYVCTNKFALVPWRH